MGYHISVATIIQQNNECMKVFYMMYSLKHRVTWKCTLPSVKQIANGNLLYDSGNSKRDSVSTQRGGIGREFQKGGDICIPWQSLDYLICNNQRCRRDEFQAAVQLRKFVIRTGCCACNAHRCLQHWGLSNSAFIIGDFCHCFSDPPTVQMAVNMSHIHSCFLVSASFHSKLDVIFLHKSYLQMSLFTPAFGGVFTCINYSPSCLPQRVSKLHFHF